VIALLIIGAVGVGLLLISLLFGDLLDGVFEGFDIDTGGLLSTEVVGAFLGAFGFGGALLRNATTLSWTLSIGGGVVAGLIVGAIAFMIVRLVVDMPTDATPRSADLAGKIARVITRIPQDGLGEITVQHAGHRVKMNARAHEPIASGTDVVIIDVLSPTAVLVAEADI
jgi:membrane protein implicated in regulation of membrane protease activity